MRILEWSLSGVRVALVGVTNPHTGRTRPLTDRDVADVKREHARVGGPVPVYIERELLE